MPILEIHNDQTKQWSTEGEEILLWNKYFLGKSCFLKSKRAPCWFKTKIQRQGYIMWETVNSCLEVQTNIVTMKTHEWRSGCALPHPPQAYFSVVLAGTWQHQGPSPPRAPGGLHCSSPLFWPHHHSPPPFTKSTRFLSLSSFWSHLPEV